ncbi:PAS domain-containing sensor histidine kinase [Streptomyces boninensis]|uniref:PAS domain-containing sensor histidine kinase n=1 Tax=Streptomyces boninensis TaxID=2039455 RepID=UPI003B20E49D
MTGRYGLNEPSEPSGYPSAAVVAAAPDGIVAVGEDGIIRLCNPAAAVLFGRTPGELVGLPFGFPVTADGPAEIDLVVPSGSGRVVEMRVTATRASGERLHIATLRDVTERRRAQRDLETVLSRQDMVIAVTAHELRHPLATIGVLAHTLRDADGSLTDERRLDLTNRIIDCTARLQSLVRRHLTAARIDAEATPATTPQPVPVLEFILEQLGALHEDAPEVEVSCALDVVAYADRGDLSEMLLNYLENAFTHGSPPVRIRVTTSAHHIDIRVQDAGPGVPDDLLPHLFTRFSRTPGASPARQGTGLGLWIVRALARAGGGDAWYEPRTRPDAGFHLRLPRPPPKPPQS